MMKNYNITRDNIAYTFKDVLISLLTLIVILGFLGGDLDPEDYSTYKMTVVIVGITYFAIHVFPNLMLIWDYLDQDNVESLTIGDGDLIIDGRSIRFNEIRKIIAVGTYQHFNPPISATSLPYFDYFYFLILITTEGERFILTSLLGHKLDKELKKTLGQEQFEYKFVFFPLVETYNDLS